MPKLKATEMQQKNNIIGANMEKNMRLYGIKKDRAAIGIRVSKATFDRRVREPTKMTVEQFIRMSGILKFTNEQILEMLGR